MQLLESIKRLNIIPREEFESTVGAYVEYCSSMNNKKCGGKFI